MPLSVNPSETLFGCRASLEHIVTPPSPLCATTLKVWDKNRRFLISPNSPLKSFLGQNWFSPGRDISSFQIWRQKGLLRLLDAAPKGKIQEKKQTEKKAGCTLPWLEYLQVSHLIAHMQMEGLNPQHLLLFEKLMAKEYLPKTGLISLLYKLILDHNMPVTFAFQHAWETDLNIQMEPEVWGRIRMAACYSTRVTNTQLIAYKVLYRWHLTPS